MDRETRLGVLASAILDGTPVDWSAADSTAEAAERGVVRKLQIVAEIAALHRRTDQNSPAETADAPPPTEDSATWGHLRLLDLIGRGTYGEVYRAWDTHLDRQVALKLLRTTAMAEAPMAPLNDPVRLVHEGRLLARIRHPNVITVYGAEPRDGAVGIWMEFISGRTLHQIVDQQGPLGAREAAGIGADLCRALAAVHGAGLLHRDVTARNVMREDGGRVVLMDFGAGHERRDRGADSRQDVTGTPLYMAPELFDGAHSDDRTDIYALGALLFYLVTGSFPVTGQSLAALREAHRNGTRTRLRDLRADLPGPFVRAVERAVAANPTDRFQTVGGLEAALDQAVLDGGGISPVSSRQWMLIGGGALAAVILAAAVVSSLRSGAGDPLRADSSPPVGAGQLNARRVSSPAGVFVFSNPSDDGRHVAGMVHESGDVAIVDLATGDYRPLHVGRDDGSDGYASLGALSPDGGLVAVDWYYDWDASMRMVGTDGQPSRVLVDPPGDVRTYQWSRDGSLILASLGRDEGNVLALVAARDGGVRTLRLLGSDVPNHAALSDDGRYVVYDYAEHEGAPDHDLFVLDAHTGEQWPLNVSPGHDVSPFWTPDGRAVIFLSDRNRNPSIWMIAVENGKPKGVPQMLKDNIGRVVLRGFTKDGALHYQASAGFAEVYLGSIGSPAPPQPISPRQALSNYYPMWSRDGAYVAYTSERGRAGRELWVYTVESGREFRVPVGFRLGRVYGWSQDSRSILVSGPDDGRLYIVDRNTGRADLVASGLQRGPAWTPAGIVYDAGTSMIVFDPALGRPVRTFDYGHPGIAVVGRPSLFDGRSVLSQRMNGELTLHDTSTGRARTWQDSGVVALREHVMAPHGSGVAYTVRRKSVGGDAVSLMLWGGAGDPRELLRAEQATEHFRLVGWSSDERDLYVIRWSSVASTGRRVGDDTLWRVPTTGGPPLKTGLALAGLRDISIHPDGRQIVFNAGFRRNEEWVMENVLPR